MPVAVGHFYNEEAMLESEMTCRPTTAVSQRRIKLVPLHANIHSFNEIPPISLLIKMCLLLISNMVSIFASHHVLWGYRNRIKLHFSAGVAIPCLIVPFNLCF